MAINANPPPWLQQAWTPREPFDPTPWLQERYRRQLIEAELPGRIQAQALENEQRLLGIQIQNQQQELYAQDLSTYGQWLQEVGTDPARVLNTSPQLRTPAAQQMVLNAKKMAAENQYVQARQANHVKMAEAAAKLTMEGFPVEPTVQDPVTGGMTFDPAVIAQAGEALSERKRQEAMSLVIAREATQDNRTSAEKNTDALLRAKQDMEAAAKSSDQAALNNARLRYETLQGIITPANETTTSVVDPATGAVTVTTSRGKQGATPSDLTPTNRTKVQESLSTAVELIDTANRLSPLLDNETVGAQAFAESWIKDRLLAQRFPELASSKRATAEALAADLRSKALRSLRSDSNISEVERKQIEEAVPEINSPVDSPARAKQLTSTIRKMAAIKAAVTARKLGEAVPVAAAEILDEKELIRLVKLGVITKEQAAAIYDQRAGR